MTITPQLIQSTLALNTTFTVGNTGVSNPNTLVITDASVWTNIVSASTDKVNIILQILDPAGNPVYQNTGWATGSFASPDLYFGTVPVTATPSITLSYDQNGNLITGTFTVNAQVEVIQNYASSPIITLGTGVFYPVLNSAYLQKNLGVNMLFAPNYMNANMTVSDNTSYGSYASIVRSITVTPPVQANQSPFTNASNSVLVTGLWAPAPYQGKLNNQVTYVSGSTATVSYIIYYQNFDTQDNLNFCDLYCCLKGLWVQRQSLLGKNTPFFNQLSERIQAGLNILEMCYEAAACSDETSIQGYITQFYCVTGCTAGCSCGCTDTPSPVVPVSPSQGPAGANGVSITNVAITGGDLIITLSNSTTINAGAIPAGAAGTNGTDSLWVPIINPQSTTTYTQIIPANTLTTLGDFIRIRCFVNVPAQGAGYIQFKIGSVVVGSPVEAQSANTALCIIDMTLQYVNSTTGGCLNVQEYYITNPGLQGIFETKLPYNISSFTWNPTIANNFVVDFSPVTGSAAVGYLEAIVNKI